MENLEESIEDLKNIACKADKILREELEKGKIDYTMAEVRVYNIKTVGVGGDNRTYGHPVEITLYQKGNFLWNENLLKRLSTRITNEIENTNKVVCTIGF